MERIGEVAAVSRGKEPLIKRVWYGVGKFAESQRPEAWEYRVSDIIKKQVLPKLSPSQQEWAAKHHEAIRDACAYVGAGITTAEIIGAVLVLEKLVHVRDRLFFATPVPKVISVDRIASTQHNVIDPIGVLVKSVDQMPKGLLSYLRQVVKSGEHSGLDSFSQLGLGATLLTIFANKANPEYAAFFAELALDAGNQDVSRLDPAVRKLFSRAYEDTAKQFRWDPRALDPDELYSHWVDEGAPGIKRVLQVSGVPMGRAKHLVGLMRNSIYVQPQARPDVYVDTDTTHKLPGFNFVLKKMLDTPPPQSVYGHMREAVRVLSSRGNQISKEQRLDMERHIARVWVDYAMPNLAKRPETRRAFLAQLEAEGYPGMPRPTVQSLQEYLAREYLPVSRSRRVIDQLNHDLSRIDTVTHHRKAKHMRNQPNASGLPAKASVMPSERDEAQLQRSREQSERQREYNDYIRELKSAVRKIKRDERKAIIADIDARLAPERERLRKISHIHEVARETPDRIKAITKRVEALRARIKLRRERKEKAKAAKEAKPVA